MYKEEVKSRFYDLSDEKQIDVQIDHFLTLDDSIKSILRYYKEQHCTEWKSMMREMLPKFLSPAILNKFWMIKVKNIAEDQIHFHIVRDLKYDGAKCYDFAHIISQKHVMDLTSKMYKRYLENFGMKLWTKIPKDGNLPRDDEQIYINHAKFDISLKATYVYCVSSLKINSSRECTKIFSNEIDPLTSEVEAGFADESSYGESGEAFLGFGYKSSNGKSDVISLYCFILYGINNIFF
jgi:hypothetical protein